MSTKSKTIWQIQGCFDSIDSTLRLREIEGVRTFEIITSVDMPFFKRIINAFRLILGNRLVCAWFLLSENDYAELKESVCEKLPITH